MPEAVGSWVADMLGSSRSVRSSDNANGKKAASNLREYALCMCHMIEQQLTFDRIDIFLLEALGRDGSLSQRELADRVGLSQNACWRRLKRLQDSGVLKGTASRIDFARFGLDLTVFVMIRTRHHADDWSRKFRVHVESLPEVTDFYRIGGEWDYLIKAVTAGMAGYDRFYQALIKGFDLERVTGYFSMEPILEDRPPRLTLAPHAI